MEAPTTEETTKMAALRTAIGTLPSWCDDACLRRYLRARSGKEMIRASIQWRAKEKPEQIAYDEVKEVLDLRTLYLNGHDLQGRPLIYVKPGAENPYTPEKRLRALLFILETAIRVMPTNVEQLVWILDFSEYSFRATTAESKQVSKQSVELLQTHYPERLGLSLVVSPPWFFSIMLTIVSPFMNAVTRSKIYVIGGSGEKLKKGLLEYVAEDQLERQYGGTNPNGYTPPATAGQTTATPAGDFTATATLSTAPADPAPISAVAQKDAVAKPPAALTPEQQEEQKTKSYLNMDVD